MENHRNTGAKSVKITSNKRAEYLQFRVYALEEEVSRLKQENDMIRRKLLLDIIVETNNPPSPNRHLNQSRSVTPVRPLIAIPPTPRPASPNPPSQRQASPSPRVHMNLESFEATGGTARISQVPAGGKAPEEKRYQLRERRKPTQFLTYTSNFKQQSQKL